MGAPASRQPVIFVPHGGGPWPFVDMGLPERYIETMRGYFRSLPAALPAPPKALLVASAHWEEAVPTPCRPSRSP